MEYIEAEDLQTNFIDIGPVNKVRKQKFALEIVRLSSKNDSYIICSAPAENISSRIVKN